MTAPDFTQVGTFDDAAKLYGLVRTAEELARGACSSMSINGATTVLTVRDLSAVRVFLAAAAAVEKYHDLLAKEVR